MENSIKNLDKIIDSIPVGIVVLSGDNTVQNANDTALRLLGLEVEDIVGARVFDAFGVDEVCDSVKRIRNRGAGVENFMFEHEGRYVKCSVTRPAGDESRSLIIVLEDVTGFRDMEKIKREFLQVILHSLRSPLSTLKTSLSILSSNKISKLPQQVGEIIDMSTHEVNRLNTLLADLRNLFYIETGLAEKELDNESFAVERVLNRAVQDLGKSHNNYANIANRIRREGNGEIVLYADFEKTKQIFQHLIRNAHTFSPGMSPVVIRMSRLEQNAAVEIIDQGIGVAAGQQKYLFTKFYREDNEITRSVPGNGLGLFISRSLAELMNGSIYCETGKGKGSAFTLNLPLMQER